jgi:hypothetical protein
MTTKKKIDDETGRQAARSVSDHAQGFVFGIAIGVIFGAVGTALVLWAAVEPIVR